MFIIPTFPTKFHYFYIEKNDVDEKVLRISALMHFKTLVLSSR